MIPIASRLRDLAQKGRNNYLLITTSIIIVTLIADTTSTKIADLTFKSPFYWVIVIFAAISAISLVGQKIILRFVRQKAEESGVSRKNLHLNLTEKIVTIVYYSIAAIFVFVVLQMFVLSSYNVMMLIAAVTISYIFAIAMMMLLGWRFFNWFRVNRSYVVLLYGLSSAVLAVNAAVSLYLVDSILFNKPVDVFPHAMNQFPSIYSGSVTGVLNSAYIATTITAYIVTWSATVVLLNYITQRIGKLRYLIILALPLVYFVSQFVVIPFNLLGSLLMSDPIFFGTLFTLFFTLSKPIGGIIFGIAFLIMARNVGKDSMLRSYVIISGFGFMLLFTSNQAMVLTFAPYPPFGLATISFVGLSSYLILVGIYYSALSISQDTKLRREIRKVAIKEVKLLDIIGHAQMEQELQNKVLTIAKKASNEMTEETGVQTSLTQEDMKQYLDDVLGEIKEKKQKKGSLA